MWRNRNVWIVLTGEFIAGLGLWTSIIANLEFMQKHVPSDFMKSLILFSGLLAGVLIGPYAGRLIDASRKKTVLIYAGLGRMLSVCFMFVALYRESVGWMVLFMISIQLSAAFYFPALQAVIPMIVKERELIALNGVHMNAATLARILGTSLAGVMLVVMSLYSLYLASLIAYAALFAISFFLKVDEPEPDKAVAEPTDEGLANNGQTGGKRKTGGFKEVLPVLKSRPVSMAVLGLTLIPTLFIGGFNLVVIAISELQDSSQIKGMLYAVEGTCFILGAFLVKRLPLGQRLLKPLILFSFLMAAAQLLLFFSAAKLPALLAFGLFGIAIGCFFPITSTYFQTAIPKEYHGRFFSFRGIFDRVLFQVVLLATGFFLDTIGLKWMVVVFGTFSTVLALIAFLYADRIVKPSSEPAPQSVAGTQH